MLNDIESLSKILDQSVKKKEYIPKEEVEVSNDIWDADEVGESPVVEDGRDIPEYTINYKQSVASEDIFLGLSGKSHSIMHADDLCIKIMLPGVTIMSEITLVPSNHSIDVRSTQ